MPIFQTLNRKLQPLAPRLRWKTRYALLLWLLMGIVGATLMTAGLIIAFIALFPLALIMLVFAFFKHYHPVQANSGRYVVYVKWD